MCHYAQLTFPEPAVIVVILYEPLVAVEPVKPAPIVIVPSAVKYLSTTIPEPPLKPPPPPPAPPPAPVLVVPATPLAVLPFAVDSPLVLSPDAPAPPE